MKNCFYKLTIGLILAGGEARRFGGGKCQAILQGKPLIQWVYESIKPFTFEIWLSVKKQEDFGLTFTKVIKDPFPGAGPAVALRETLKHVANNKVLLVTSCDQPLIQKKLLKGLVSFFDPHQYEIAVFIDEKGKILPFPGLYKASLKNKKVNALRDFLKNTKALIIKPELWRKWDPKGLSFYNINYRKDLERLEKGTP
ncbi:formate dehydrogenase accessory protein FdhD [Thermodesulfatator indicus DSM 15286]|uniref:Formate dehydrogenase accessory protein FdhD n=1 Tax=Thermodesulfatator indicus (strain DSM 15286 / JCM 11887 / CIR29812) TaxID=667014 RepID=F8A9X2_THEID|nr:molybdenum cofactor guanylyltransferase [Thermodesulfatator indicus]AEH44171.1 formate dehydrogenase accessory protein FdhD [Thermodesulfatator indicus DSM 15286]